MCNGPFFASIVPKLVSNNLIQGFWAGEHIWSHQICQIEWLKSTASMVFKLLHAGENSLTFSCRFWYHFKFWHDELTDGHYCHLEFCSAEGLLALYLWSVWCFLFDTIPFRVFLELDKAWFMDYLFLLVVQFFISTHDFLYWARLWPWVKNLNWVTFSTLQGSFL